VVFVPGNLEVRPIRPEDAAAYSDFVARIDDQDLRRRFAGPVGPLRDGDLAGHARIDHDRGMTFVAVQESDPGSAEIVGEVCAYRYPEGLAAELGIIVRSDMKGRGVGRALMEALIAYTRENRLELIGQIAQDNEAMIALAERCGMEVEHPPGTDIAVAHLGPSNIVEPKE
jgi:acetyltransferase